MVVGYIVREVSERVLEKENFQLNKFVVSKSSVCGGTGITREGLQVWYTLGLHYNTHGKYIVMETLYFFADFFIYHEPYTNETRMTG